MDKLLRIEADANNNASAIEKLQETFKSYYPKKHKKYIFKNALYSTSSYPQL